MRANNDVHTGSHDSTDAERSASSSCLDLQDPLSAQHARTGNPGARTTMNAGIASPPSAASGLQQQLEAYEARRILPPSAALQAAARTHSWRRNCSPCALRSSLHLHLHPEAEDGANQHLHQLLRRPAPGRSIFTGRPSFMLPPAMWCAA